MGQENRHFGYKWKTAHSQSSLKRIWSFRTSPPEDPQEAITHTLRKTQSRGRSCRTSRASPFWVPPAPHRTCSSGGHHLLLELLPGYALLPGDVPASSSGSSPPGSLTSSLRESLQNPPLHSIRPTFPGLLRITHHVYSFIRSTLLRTHLPIILFLKKVFFSGKCT